MNKEDADREIEDLKEEDQKELMSLQECALDLEAVIEDKLQKRRLHQG